MVHKKIYRFFIFSNEIIIFFTVLRDTSFDSFGWDFCAAKIAFKAPPVLDQRHALLITHVEKTRIGLINRKHFRVSLELIGDFPYPSVLLVDLVNDLCIVVRYP